MDCTNTGCGRQTSLFLCVPCILELDDLLQQVPMLVVALDPAILAFKVTKQPGANSETRNTNKASSQAPLNPDIDLLRDNLKTLLHKRAHHEAANNPHAEQTITTARMWTQQANNITHGTEQQPINHEANTARINEIAPPMITRRLLPWLRTNARITITSQNVRDWVRRGHLTPATREPQPTYHPHEVITAWYERNN